MKATLATDGTLMFWCPGCKGHHGVPVDGSRGWEWNGSLELPTISPSILVRQILYGTEKLTFSNYHGEHPPETSAEGVCHSFVRDGKIEFLGDCTHKLAGQTVDLPDIDDTMNKIEYNGLDWAAALLFSLLFWVLVLHLAGCKF